MRYAVVIEKGKKNYGVYCPDVPGCISVGDTVEECLLNIREALQFHFEGLREDREPIPDPVSLVDYVEVPLNSTGSAVGSKIVKQKKQPAQLRSLDENRKLRRRVQLR